MDKRFLVILGVIVGVFAGVVVYQSHSKNGNAPSGAAQPTNHVEGNLNSKVTLLEYGDYECPACESFNPIVQAVQQKYNTSIKYQFRNLPLSQIHPNAIGGARAAEAAAMQGKFWQMHDALYSPANWQQWSTSSNPDPYFWQYAQTLGLNVGKFKADFASSTVNDRINADIAAFAKTGKSESTPTFFLNGTYISNNSLVSPDGQPSIAAFSKIIDAALKSAK